MLSESAKDICKEHNHNCKFCPLKITCDENRLVKIGTGDINSWVRKMNLKAKKLQTQ